MSNIVVISGGHRPSGESPRIAKWFAAELQQQGHVSSVIDLATNVLPLWDEGLWGAPGLADKWQTLWQPLSAQLKTADAVIIVAPEYHGMAPAALMNLFTIIGNGPELAHKPALLVSVSSGVNGVYPVSMLSAYGHKNSRMVILPEHIIVRSAPHMLQDTPAAEHADNDAWLRKRIGFVLPQLTAYADALKTVRSSVAIAHPDFANGM